MKCNISSLLCVFKVSWFPFHLKTTNSYQQPLWVHFKRNSHTPPRSLCILRRGFRWMGVGATSVFGQSNSCRNQHRRRQSSSSTNSITKHAFDRMLSELLTSRRVALCIGSDRDARETSIIYVKCFTYSFLIRDLCQSLLYISPITKKTSSPRADDREDLCRHRRLSTSEERERKCRAMNFFFCFAGGEECRQTFNLFSISFDF